MWWISRRGCGFDPASTCCASSRGRASAPRGSPYWSEAGPLSLRLHAESSHVLLKVAALAAEAAGGGGDVAFRGLQRVRDLFAFEVAARFAEATVGVRLA